MVEPSGEERDRLLVQWLTEAAPKADPGFRRQLRAQVLQELEREERTMVVQNRGNLWRLVGAAVALVLLLLVVLTPAGEALADLLTLGWYRFTDDPTLAEEHIEEPVDSARVVRLQTRRFASASAASAEADFTVLAPTYLPEGYLPERAGRPVELVLSSDGSVDHAQVDYLDEDFGYLGFEQVRYDRELEEAPIGMGTGDVEPQPVTINGAEGVFFDGIVWGSERDEDGELVPVRYNVLLWQQEVEGQSFLFWLHSSERLPLAELVRVAESLAP